MPNCDVGPPGFVGGFMSLKWILWGGSAAAVKKGLGRDTDFPLAFTQETPLLVVVVA